MAHDSGNPRDSSGYEYMETSIEGEGNDVFAIRFDRAEKLNAADRQFISEATQVLYDARHVDASVVTLTGKGEAFCAGGDIGPVYERTQDDSKRARPEDLLEVLERFSNNIVHLSKPLVVRVNGDATGFGSTLALTGDIVVADEEARIGDTHLNIGLSNPIAGSFWPLDAGLKQCKEFLLTGDLMTAADAEEMGLINHAVPRGELDEKVEDIVDRIASGPQTSIRMSKLALNSWMQFAFTMNLREALTMEQISFRTDDHEHATEAFLNKQKEVFFPSASRGPHPNPWFGDE